MQPSLEKLKEIIENGRKTKIEFNREQLLEELTGTVHLLLERTQWFRTIKIENKEQELKRFKDARKKDRDFKPEFEFQEFPYSRETLLEILEECRAGTDEIAGQHLESYGAEELTPEDLQELFTGILDEIELYIKLASNIDNEENWRNYSEEIWPMVDQETAGSSKQELKQIEKGKLRETLTPEQVKRMFEQEIARLGMNYGVETRKTAGCFNSPEEKTVVVAEGEKRERMYSKEEAEMVTVHELFHAVRAYNGFKAGEESGFSEILGLHTPFYDRAEEGGALYREKATGTMYDNKEFDYHLRLIAAYKLSQSDDFKKEFSSIAEELIQLGGTEGRALNLLARNREALRHHIYLSGYHDWKEIENKEKMLLGKVNKSWADRLWKEIEAEGMLREPEIGEEKLFDFTFKDSE
ncbi:MAG: hypothetical protein BRC29_05135 [Nanohaloarchaea archaeon SW_7_43_1]|nr:MAG: hypothetical protein BRC29_05135 [Nanohaloarchaea archaeon SW_7_43_1]